MDCWFQLTCGHSGALWPSTASAAQLDFWLQMLLVPMLVPLLLFRSSPWLTTDLARDALPRTDRARVCRPRLCAIDMIYLSDLSICSLMSHDKLLHTHDWPSDRGKRDLKCFSNGCTRKYVNLILLCQFNF